VYRALRPGGIVITHEPGAGHSKSPDSIRAMELYGVTEKDMPPAHIRDLCREIGFSSFRCVLDPTRAVMIMYGINIATEEHLRPPWYRRMLSVGRAMLDRRLEIGGICVITK
jgi:hypothetical protein